ncbi:MAG: homocitrate synthase [candidate division KSB1 bacterium]|nr:homocitrate synthase [candidate division KSB1 bacterium]
MSISQFQIIDSTLREGEQFSYAHFTTQDKIKIASGLADFGVEYIEITSPAASPQSYHDAQILVSLGLKPKILAHVRCHIQDVAKALETGVDGINLFMGTSQYLQKYSHGKSMDQILEKTSEVINYARRERIEIRFSCEDALRSDPEVLETIYQHVTQLGVDRIGVTDTVGVATPFEVSDLIGRLRQKIAVPIEFHAHNDSGCAIANSYAALQAGATYIDTSILGIGERNGITPLGGLIARLYATDKALVSKYRLQHLSFLENLVAEVVGIQVPFNNCITGPSAFHHKAGLHTNAVLNNPSTYEIFDPTDFGLTRTILVAHRLTGKHAIRNRACQLGIDLSEEALLNITLKVKDLADKGHLAAENDIDQIIKNYSNYI